MHFSGISGNDHREFIPFVIHAFQYDFQGLFSEVIAAFFGGQRIGFIDEEYAIHGRINDGAAFRGRLADELSHEVRTVYLNHVTFWEQTEGFVNAADKAGYGSFACPRGAKENAVQRNLIRFITRGDQFLLCFDEVDQGNNVLFDLLKAHHGVELGHNVIQRFHLLVFKLILHGCRDIIHRDGQQGFVGQVVHIKQGKPGRLQMNGLFEEVAGCPGIAEMLVARAVKEIEITHYLAFRFRGKNKFPVAADGFEDLCKLFRIVIVEVEVSRKTVLQAGIGGNHPFHFIGIAGHNHHQVVFVVFHPLHQDIDGLFAEIVARI